jgi:Mn-dependent DtxR family transcriptional regulator
LKIRDWEVAKFVTTADFKKFIESLASEKAPGPSTTFSMFHIFSALELMEQNPIGRNKLAENLKVGEGAIRTIINRLKDAKLIEITKKGCCLTDKGLETWSKFKELFPSITRIEKNELTHSKYNWAFLVKDSGHKIKSGIEQRDAAIMGGAKRAIVIVSKKGHLVIDSVSCSVEKEYPEATKKILKNISPENNDAIIVAGADDDSVKAKRGAFAAAWVLASSKA